MLLTYELVASSFMVHIFMEFIMLYCADISVCAGAGVHRPFPLAKDGPCAGTKGYRAPEVHINWFIFFTEL